MILGSLYSGIGGLDVACEWAFSARTAWQLDLVGADVRRRHWPDALQVEADIATVDPLDLPRVDILCGGFACQDLSCAGLQAGLIDGERTGPTYRHLVRFATALQPDLVVMENVPALLSRWRVHLEHDWGRLGYGLTWVPCMALDAGAPHRRRRVFVVAERGAVGRGVVEVDTGGRWDPVESERVWATPTVLDSKVGRKPYVHTRNGRSLCADLPGKRLRPEWVEILQGFPQGWTDTEGPLQHVEQAPRWPRGRYPEDWDRTVPWPGYPWEPPRTLPDGPPARGRPARIRALGNAVVPAQASLALRAWSEPEQAQLFGVAK